MINKCLSQSSDNYFFTFHELNNHETNFLSFFFRFSIKKIYRSSTMNSNYSLVNDDAIYVLTNLYKNNSCPLYVVYYLPSFTNIYSNFSLSQYKMELR